MQRQRRADVASARHPASRHVRLPAQWEIRSVQMMRIDNVFSFTEMMGMAVMRNTHSSHSHV